jgi:hypothetical protein
VTKGEVLAMRPASAAGLQVAEARLIDLILTLKFCRRSCTILFPDL